MRVRITVSIASADWSFIPQQIVDVVGETYTLTSIPVDVAEKWLAGGHAERVADGTPVTPMAPQSEPVALRRTPTGATLESSSARAGEILT